jgi:hypothetical protein
MSLILSPPQTGVTGNVVHVMSKYGHVERQLVIPQNPRAPDQQEVRGNFTQVTGRWKALSADQRLAWRIAAADSFTVTRLGRRVPLNPYNYFCRINFARADLGLSQFDLPPTVPTFSPNPIQELLIVNDGGVITLKLRVPSLPAEHTVVMGAAPCSPGVSCPLRWTAGATSPRSMSPATACR